MGTVSLAVISVKTTFYFCKNLITNERYTLCMCHVAYHVASHFIALYFICVYVLYMWIQLGGVVNKCVCYYYYYYYVRSVFRTYYRQSKANFGTHFNRIVVSFSPCAFLWGTMFLLLSSVQLQQMISISFTSRAGLSVCIGRHCPPTMCLPDSTGFILVPIPFHPIMQHTIVCTKDVVHFRIGSCTSVGTWKRSRDCLFLRL